MIEKQNRPPSKRNRKKLYIFLIKKKPSYDILKEMIEILYKILKKFPNF